MILSPGRGYVFIHIPKTGGTSLALALEARAMKEDIMLGDTPKALKRRRRVTDAQTRGRLWKHSTLADLDGLVPRETLLGLFAFTLVRNPWDRAVSYYHWLLGQAFDHPAVKLAQALDFEGFLGHPAIQKGFRDTPAASYMHRPDGGEHPATYIRVEHFAADAQPLFDHLGFRFDLPHANRSERPDDYRRAYSANSADIISRVCAQDIARFGYRFEV